MKFYTNKISTGKSADFGEFVKKVAASNATTKTASTETVKKEANIANFGDKAATPFGKKDEAKKDEKAKVPCDKEEKDCEATAEKEIKVAEDKTAKCKDEAPGRKHEVDPVGGTNTGKPEDAKKTKKASNDEVAPENKGVTHKVDECCGAPTSGDGSEGDKSAKKSEPKAEPKAEEKKEASAPKKYVKIANLDSKTKSEWKNYWKKIYPSSYVDAMFADK